MLIGATLGSCELASGLPLLCCIFLDRNMLVNSLGHWLQFQPITDFGATLRPAASPALSLPNGNGANWLRRGARTGELTGRENTYPRIMQYYEETF